MRYDIEKVVQMIVHDILEGRISRGLLALSCNEDRHMALCLFGDYSEVTGNLFEVSVINSTIRFDGGSLKVDGLQSDDKPNNSNMRDCFKHGGAQYNAIYYDSDRMWIVGNNTGFWKDCDYLRSRLRLTPASMHKRMYFEYI